MKVEFDASDFVLPKLFTPVVAGEWEQIQPGLFRAKDQNGEFVHMLIDMESDDGGRNTEDLPTANGSMMTLVASGYAASPIAVISTALLYAQRKVTRGK